MTTTHPPDQRLDGPVHGWFELSYSNYLVLPRTLMQSMPEEWQQRMVACLDEISAAFQHIKHADYYEVTAAEERYYQELTDAEMNMLGISREPAGEVDGQAQEADMYYDRNGVEHYGHDRLLVPRPGGDPVPHYNRGRTYVEPQSGR